MTPAEVPMICPDFEVNSNHVLVNSHGSIFVGLLGYSNWKLQHTYLESIMYVYIIQTYNVRYIVNSWFFCLSIFIWFPYLAKLGSNSGHQRWSCLLQSSVFEVHDLACYVFWGLCRSNVYPRWKYSDRKTNSFAPENRPLNKFHLNQLSFFRGFGC